MRILIVSYDDRPSIGGMGACVRQTVDELRRTHPEMEVQVLSPGPESDVRAPALIRSRFKRPFGCPVFSVYLCFALPRIIRQYSPDIVHVHAGSGGVFLLRGMTVPLLVTAHHTYMQEVVHVFYDRALKRVMKWLMSLLERRTYQLATRILAVSEDTRQALVTDYAVPAERIHVLENAVTVSVIAAVDPEPDTIVSVGRLEPRKATHEMLCGFAELLKIHPTARLRLIGSNLLGSALDRMLHALSITHAVAVLGRLDDAAMEQELAAAACVLVPSRLEGFGLIAAQSMMMGKCTVAADAPGLRSLIRHGDTGFLFSMHDSRSIASVVHLVLSDPELRQKVGRAAQADARLRFDRSAQTMKLMQMYTSLHLQ
jgi:glycosyltransferase involved in cell wall biosynthesis